MENALTALVTSLLALPLYVGVAYLIYFFMSLPLRRRERARLCLHLIEHGLRNGIRPEQMLASAAASGDRVLGIRFHLLAAHLETGLDLDQALAQVPRFLPPEIVAMLRVGRELGDIAKVLPACRQRLEDGVAIVWTAHHYLVLLALVLSPAWIAVFSMLAILVVPRLAQIAEDLGGQMPAAMVFILEHQEALIAIQATLAAGFYFALALYVGGPRVVGWIQAILPKTPDWVAWLTPWRRPRLQRDFSAMLSALLDGGVPEAAAVRLAAQSTANAVFCQRAEAAIRDLEAGRKLPEAIRHVDPAGEFRWRLENAAHRPGRFRAALEGWHEALSARAFQWEQTTAQLVTTGLVLLNGLFVGGLASGIFVFLISIIQQAALW